MFELGIQSMFPNQEQKCNKPIEIYKNIGKFSKTDKMPLDWRQSCIPDVSKGDTVYTIERIWRVGVQKNKQRSTGKITEIRRKEGSEEAKSWTGGGKAMLHTVPIHVRGNKNCGNCAETEQPGELCRSEKLRAYEKARKLWGEIRVGFPQYMAGQVLPTF